MEETLRQKQLYLRENILDKGYSTDNFMDLLHSKKGEQGLDLNNWTMCYPYGNYNSENHQSFQALQTNHMIRSCTDSQIFACPAALAFLR